MHGWMLRLVALLMLSTAAAQTAAAAKRLSFVLDYVTTKATHIVLATEGDEIDGKLEVVESWKGDLNPGALLTIPELARFESEESRTVQWRGATDLPAPYVRVVTGQEMLLFLAEPSTEEDAQRHKWLPAIGNEFELSVAWIDNGEAYAIQQIINPGPAELQRYDNVLAMKANVSSYLTIQAGLDEAKNAQSPMGVCQAIRAFKQARHYYAMTAAIESLHEMGEAGLPGILTLIHDPTFHDHHVEFIEALAKTGGQSVAPDLTAIVEEGLTFWTRLGPKLNENWWNQTENASKRSHYRNEYHRLFAAISALRDLDYEPCRAPIQKTLDLWTRTPALSEPRQMRQICELVLSNLDGATPS